MSNKKLVWTREEIMARRERFLRGAPSLKKAMLSDAHELALKWNCPAQCERCGNVKSWYQWPAWSDGRKHAHCGECVSPTAKLPDGEARCRDVERKREARARAAAKAGKPYQTAQQRTAASHERKRRRRLATIQRREEQERITASLHDAHVKTMRGLTDAEYFRWRYRNDEEFALRQKLRSQFRKKAQAVPALQAVIGAAIKNGGESRTVERVLGYTIRDLRRHLERQFTGRMSWACWSRDGWHIDHILPRKCFDLTTLDGVRAYWALPNLRPLWAHENRKKRDKVEFLA